MPHLVKHLDQTSPIDCPFGSVHRIITGGEGDAIANVHRVRVTQGSRHLHSGYNEVYYVLEGTGRVVFDDREEELRAGSVVVIPAGVPHAVFADEAGPLDFIIFGTPGMDVGDERFRPIKD